MMGDTVTLWTRRIIWFAFLSIAIIIFLLNNVERKWFSFFLETVVVYAGVIRLTAHFGKAPIWGSWLGFLLVHTVIGVVVTRSISNPPRVIWVGVTIAEAAVVGFTLMLLEAGRYSDDR
jgi:hypothetical protein